MIAPDTALREAVAALLGDRHLPFSPDTSFTRYPAPFLRRHGIWALDHAGEEHALFLFVAWAEGEPARLLSGRPGELVATVRADGGKIASSGEALAYALALVEVTRDPGPLLTVLRSAADLPLVPHPTPAELASLAALALAPPSADAVADGYAVTLDAARNDALVRIAVDVAPDGGATVTEQLRADELPLVCT